MWSSHGQRPALPNADFHGRAHAAPLLENRHPGLLTARSGAGRLVVSDEAGFAARRLDGQFQLDIPQLRAPICNFSDPFSNLICKLGHAFAVRQIRYVALRAKIEGHVTSRLGY